MAKIIVKRTGTLDYFQPLYDSKADINLIWGGRDYGKSDNIVRVLMDKCMTASYFKCIMLREYLDTIEESIYSEVLAFIENNHLGEYFHCTKSPYKITFIPNGNSFIGRGGDTPRKLKAIKNPTDLFADEADTIKEDTLDIAMGTLRASEVKTQAWLSFNPESQPDGSMMLIEKFFYPQSDDLEVFYNKKHEWQTVYEIVHNGKKVKETLSFLSLHGTLDVNPFTSPKKIAFYDSFKERDHNKYLVWRLGKLGKRSINNPFYQCFKESHHVKAVDYDPNSAIHFVMDYNANPYMPSSVWQVKRESDITYRGKHYEEVIFIRCIKEYALMSPLNSIKASCDQFKSDFKDHKGTIYLLDDATGKSSSPLNSDPEIRSLRDRFKKEMYDFTRAYKFTNSNPRVIDRREVLNEIFAYESKFIIEINTPCKKTASDFGMVKVDHDGKKLKEKYKAKDLEKGLKGEKYGHHSDIGDYIVCVVVDDEKRNTGYDWRETRLN